MRILRLQVNEKNFGLYVDAIRRASLNINRLASFRATMTYVLTRLRHNDPNPDDLYDYLIQYEPSIGHLTTTVQIAEADLQAYLEFKNSIILTDGYTMSDRLAVGFVLYSAIASGHLAIEND